MMFTKSWKVQKIKNWNKKQRKKNEIFQEKIEKLQQILVILRNHNRNNKCNNCKYFQKNRKQINSRLQMVSNEFKTKIQGKYFNLSNTVENNHHSGK